VSATAPRRWSPPPLIRNPYLRYGLLVGAVIYLVVGTLSVPVDWVRVAQGAERSGRLFGDFLRPDFTSRWTDIRIGLLESLTMSVVATAVGVVLAVPVALGAARNLSPLPVYLLCRAYVTLARTFPEIVIAIVFVVMMGFGPLAGLLTLIFATTGFIAKLLAEDLEDIDAAPLEAVRATGGAWTQVILYGVVPQVMPRFVGLSVYRLDINFRESTVLGIVGAGGIGATLTTAMSRYDFDTAGAVLLLIIGVVLGLELLAGIVRKRVS
jgi:phosphonate transport system permease protein